MNQLKIFKMIEYFFENMLVILVFICYNEFTGL